MSLAAPVSPTPTFLFLALGPCCTQPLNLRQSLLARCWRCRPQYCDCSSLACRAASICCASHAAASSKAAPPLSGTTKFSHCLHEHVSCLALRQRERRRETAGSWQSESRFRRPPSAHRPDGLAEVKLLHTSDQPCVGHGDETFVCRQLATRTIEHASWALPLALVARGACRVEQGGLRRAHNYSQLMKTIKTRVFNKV